MVQHEDFILGNASLHAQLSSALAVMAQLICNTSRPPTAQQLSESLNVSLRYLRKLMRTLSAGGLLAPHATHSDTWVCMHPPHSVSLADVYHCLLAEKEEGAAPFIPATQTDTATSASDLLMMQATMSINQTVMQNLQRFDLGRLKVAESAQMFTASLREKAQRHSLSLDTTAGS
ncbi:Rrf2 family transcriptional regulator [Noviherbaspirillum denitrificans]|nr:Rrf2 family transcriptional regulator [Noviherbaspirillum denitrificans]